MNDPQTKILKLRLTEQTANERLKEISQQVNIPYEDLCICEAMAISEDNEILSWNEKIVFNLKTREVYNPEYQFWYAKNIN